MKVKIYSFKSLSGNGKHVRMATKVIFSDGVEIKFMEKMSKKDAIKQAIYQRDKR